MSIQTECPHCGKRVKASNKLAGKTETCPGCGEQIKIPDIPIPVVYTRSSWIDRAILLAILLVLLVGFPAHIPWIRREPMPVVVSNRRPIDVEVQNSSLDVEVQNSSLDVEIASFGYNVGTLDVEVQNSSLDVEVQNDELKVNLYNHYIISGDPIPVEIVR